MPFVCVMAGTLLAFSAGCSRTELLYRNADWLIERWASGMVDATSDQRDAWGPMLTDAMAAHRRVLLPGLIGLLQALEANAGRGFSADELTCWVDVLDAAYRAHARWAVAPATVVLSDLSPPQIEHLAAELEEGNAEYRERYLDENPTEREQARIERYADRIEHWTGELSTEQLRLVAEAVRRIPDVAADWLDYRRARQQQLLALLRGGTDRAGLRHFLVDWWVDLAERPATLVAKSEQVRRASAQMLLALQQTLTPDQLASVTDRLAELRRELASVPGVDSPVVPVHDTGHGCRQLAPL